jgi:hypothetical protein
MKIDFRRNQTVTPPDDRDDISAGAVAARCFHLAAQLRGGPVRDALLAMGRDYVGRARDGARSAAVRIDAKRSQAGASPSNLFRTLVEPLPRRAVPAPVMAAAAVMPVRQAVPHTVPAAAPSAAPRYKSRIYRYSKP